ncbi:hypothetical protein L1987_29903 [Smallanthus sonchifolius]|uniref:Uncharacterized protein n=1 Tax=Smallanthus sonchifolius TaxID=185202 RepID=A0ACB9I0P5_9ASTR|nr:hypothetical protein L1987_29903 [Smallanthus sonchifolius]
MDFPSIVYGWLGNKDTELWECCEKWGSVVDVYIARKMRNFGKRFGFVWFLKAENVEKLVKNVCSVWIGSYHIFADVTRIYRKERKVEEDRIPITKGNRVYGKPFPGLDASNSFVVNDRTVWVDIQGLPLCAWSVKRFSKVETLWGEVFFLDEDFDDCQSSGRVSIRTNEKNVIRKNVSVNIEEKCIK